MIFGKDKKNGTQFSSRIIKQSITYALFLALGFANAQIFEAEDAIVDENSVNLVEQANVSGGSYVEMKEGDLSFTVNVNEEGFYAIWANYAQAYDEGGKIQNLSVNGSSAGQISFPYSEEFVKIKASAKVKLSAGENTIGIVKSWGWVDLDYIELTPYVETPFSISGALVTPDASENAKKLYGFLRENFRQKVVSGVMTNTVMLTDGKYTPNTVENQEEVAWIINASGKTPALLGLDMFHATGLNSDGEWYQGYTNATLALAEDIWNKGGIPVYCWHWKDPSHVVEAFYTESSNNVPFTTFNLNDAFSDTLNYTSFNTSSQEYQWIVRDIDIVSEKLLELKNKDVPMLWRPLHEASGGWFWWGEKSPGAAAALFRLMWDRMVNHHGLNNLIWVWTTDEAGDALEWYPGDAYVDIVGRDYYYYPREANHGSLVASFEKVKEIFEGKKIIALTENGSIPHPDSMLSDGAGWSYFMPWYGEYTMDGWAHDNTAEDWNQILNHDFVLTLDEMPGWDNYIPTSISDFFEEQSGLKGFFSLGAFHLKMSRSQDVSIHMVDVNGRVLKKIFSGVLASGEHHFSTAWGNGLQIIRITSRWGTEYFKHVNL